MRYRCLLISTLICLLLVPVWAQQSFHGTAFIGQAIEENRIDDAERMLHHDIRLWLDQSNLDTLVDYIPLKAKLAEKKSGAHGAIKAVYRYINQLEKEKMTVLQQVNAYYNAATCFESIYEMQEAYHAMTKARDYAGRLTEKKNYYLAKCEYTLGAFAYKMADIATAEKHHRISLALKLADPATSPEELYFSYNAMGAVEWHASRYDSAKLYFNQALEAVDKMPRNNINQNYRPALIKNNLVAIYQEEGNTSKALNTAYEVIYDYQRFIHSKGGDSKKQNAIGDWCAAIDNLGGIYKAIGDYKKAENLELYAYQQKQQKLGKGSPEIFISEILLGQYYSKVRDFSKAKAYLVKGLAHLNEASGDYTFWKADATYALALLYQNTDQLVEAEKAYKQSEELYETAYAGDYDNIYMDFLRNKALFLASQNHYHKAVRVAHKMGSYLKSIGEEKSTQGLLYLLNLAEINYRSKRYPEATQYSNEVLTYSSRQLHSGSSSLDSIKAEINKPLAILIRTQSAYALQVEKDTAFLVNIYNQLDTALQILERRKIFIDDPESINSLMAEHQELINFFTRISLELYRKYSGINYLERFINIREAALYSRIRSQLNKEKAIRFSHVPETIITKENMLKENIQKNLRHTGADSGQLTQYLQSVKDWEQHLAMVKKDYPQYYRLRYATLFYKLPELQQLIPDSTTLVRYYMLDSNLVALVADRHSRKIISLNAAGLTEKISTLLQNTADEQQQLILLYQIYNEVWAPLAEDVHTRKVMIIPDGVLYNVSMDMLPSEPVDHFSELASKGLLARHTFSYHYSLFMLEDMQDDNPLHQNYVAFAPGFSDHLKDKYLSSVKDSLHLDRKYLTLLPQPANNRLARKLKDIIGGDIFLNESSTASAFRHNAGNHKIIHIATHAEYNNTMPEQSGLFFAKDSQGHDDNFLTLNEIYNCPMNADLMILTACESGRPGYQDGEGLVSLAHAFNYAGSHNILTALWRIDEQSSAAIAEHFIHYLKKGLPTDEALRQAKLAYLQENEGRVLAPAYWSGLVLMGKPVVLQFNDQYNYMIWLIITMGIIAILGIILWRKKGDKRPTGASLALWHKS